jgi:hypothetical protein
VMLPASCAHDSLERFSPALSPYGSRLSRVGMLVAWGAAVTIMFLMQTQPWNAFEIALLVVSGVAALAGNAAQFVDAASAVALRSREERVQARRAALSGASS